MVIVMRYSMSVAYEDPEGIKWSGTADNRRHRTGGTAGASCPLVTHNPEPGQVMQRYEAIRAAARRLVASESFDPARLARLRESIVASLPGD
jgi:hypothetical protein